MNDYRERTVDTFVARHLMQPERKLGTDCLEYYTLNASYGFDTAFEDGDSEEDIMFPERNWDFFSRKDNTQ